MRDWKDRFRRFMVGRYGTDELNRFLLTAVLVMILGNVFARNRLVFWLEAICLILCYFRMFSRNTGRRFQENQVYLRWRFYVGEWFRNLQFRIQEGRRYKIFKCPGCGQKIRIPRGHGKIQIRCRKCGREFFGRS